MRHSGELRHTAALTVPQAANRATELRILRLRRPNLNALIIQIVVTAMAHDFLLSGQHCA
jgi:hypothetical protein